MLALFGPIKTDVLEGDLPYLKVKPQRKLSRQEQIVSAKVGRARGLRLKVKPVDRGDEATWVEIVDYLGVQAQLSTALKNLDDRRHAYREKLALPVRSPDLPDFRATTVDVSRLGLCLATSAPMAVGVRLCLEVESREPSRRPTDILAVTVWSATGPRGQHLVGVRFIEPLYLN